jgi:hypothetical protein
VDGPAENIDLPPRHHAVVTGFFGHSGFGAGSTDGLLSQLCDLNEAVKGAYDAFSRKLRAGIENAAGKSSTRPFANAKGVV